MNVFTDFHHAGLLNSLILLFEKRLGGQVFRPIGMEWAEKGYWRVFDHPATQLQYLGINGATPDGTDPLNDVVGVSQNIQNIKWYDCRDIDSGQYNKAITYEEFMKGEFDIVIASLPQHIEPFYRLTREHPKRPKFIYQIGNAWNVGPDEERLIDGVMASAKLPLIPKIPFIEYHQEFDLDVFKRGEFATNKNIYSFVNCFNTQDHFKGDFALFEEVERLLTDFTFRAYGGSCRDGAAHGTKQVAEKMREARFIWHTKSGGDGYGHVLYNSAAVGRPLITKRSYYVGKLGEELLIDGETCIDIDNLSSAQIVDKIVQYSEEPRYRLMCQAVHDNFERVVSFEREELKIREFLASLDIPV